MFNTCRAIALAQAKRPAYNKFSGKYVELRKLDLNVDIPPLYRCTHQTRNMQSVWHYLPYGPFATAEDMAQHYQPYLESDTSLVFCVLNQKTSEPIGITCLEQINPQMGTVEVASVLYPVHHQKTHANTETVYLLIQHCIKELGFRKISWRCNNENIKSKQAALRLGFEFEGIFQQDMIVKNKNRDTAWYGITNQRWALVSDNIQQWLYESNGQQHSLRELNLAITGTSSVIDTLGAEEDGRHHKPH